MRRNFRLFPFLCMVVMAVGITPAAPPKGLENWLRLHDDVISGAGPKDAADFAELRKRGVRTIITVDGAPPDLRNAAAHGLRYVHVPVGYDGIDPAITQTLAAAVTRLPKPIYVHCHHGRHRGPAAAVAACIATGRMAPQQGETWLRTAGTSTDYDGLYQSIRNTKRLDHRTLNKPIEFVESVEPDDLVTTMLKLDEQFGQLTTAIEGGDRASTRHHATLLLEHYREMARSTYDGADGPAFAQQLAKAESNAMELQQLSMRSGAPKSIRLTFQRTGEQCKLCHETVRD